MPVNAIKGRGRLNGARQVAITLSATRKREESTVRVIVETTHGEAPPTVQAFDYSNERGQHPSLETLIEQAMSVIDRVSKGADQMGSVTFRADNDNRRLQKSTD
jgi:hypothetical protein